MIRTLVFFIRLARRTDGWMAAIPIRDHVNANARKSPSQSSFALLRPILFLLCFSGHFLPSSMETGKSFALCLPIHMQGSIELIAGVSGLDTTIDSFGIASRHLFTR